MVLLLLLVLFYVTDEEIDSKRKWLTQGHLQLVDTDDTETEDA